MTASNRNIRKGILSREAEDKSYRPAYPETKLSKPEKTCEEKAAYLPVSVRVRYRHTSYLLYKKEEKNQSPPGKRTSRTTVQSFLAKPNPTH